MSVQTLTTETTASTEVPRQQGYTEWQIADGAALAVAGLLGAIAALVAIINGVRSWYRDRDGAEQQRLGTLRSEMSGLREEVDELAALCRQFKTKGELAEDNQTLKDALAHEKDSRRLADKATSDKFRDHDAAIGDLRKSHARQEALLESFGGSMTRIETMFERFTERFEDRFDRLVRGMGAQA